MEKSNVIPTKNIRAFYEIKSDAGGPRYRHCTIIGVRPGSPPMLVILGHDEHGRLVPMEVASVWPFE